jgi:glucans biosynthesis protein
VPAPGEPLDLAYRVHWQMKNEARPGSAWVAQTRRGRSYGKLQPGEEKIVIDFVGPALSALPADAQVEPVVTAGANAQVREAIAYRNEVTGGWRLALRVQRALDVPSASQPLELRAYLRRRVVAPASADLKTDSRYETLSETWTLLLPVQ